MRKAIALLMIAAMLCGVCLADASEDRYNAGKALLDAGDYLQAAEYFEVLNNYKDSADLARQARERYAQASAKAAPAAQAQAAA
ncbi:MAG: hypothetical protein IJ646_12320, partial [Clostridia bacterium]|nr:hypothetical protein [Clostridia bacterium]